MYEGHEGLTSKEPESLVEPTTVGLPHSLEFLGSLRRLRSLDHAGPEPEPERC